MISALVTLYILCSFANGAEMSYPCWRFHLHSSKLYGGVRSAQHLNLPNGNKWIFRSFQALGSQRTSFEGHGWYVFSNCHLISICLSPFSSFLLLPPPPVNPTLSLRDLYISLLGWPPLIRPCLLFYYFLSGPLCLGAFALQIWLHLLKLKAESLWAGFVLKEDKRHSWSDHQLTVWKAATADVTQWQPERIFCAKISIFIPWIFISFCL